MKKKIFLIVLFFLFRSTVFPAVMDLKNILTIEGLQENPLLGYGIVVGLKGTGDSDNSYQTKEIISRIINNFGFQVEAEKIKPKNSAVVLVSALLKPFSQPGTHIDVKVSSIFDAKSLEGGELIITPLIAGDNEIYAIAQGSVVVDRMQKGVIGYIPQGAIIQRKIENNIVDSNNNIVFIVQETLGYNAISKVVESIREKYPDSIYQVDRNRLVIKVPEGIEAYKYIDSIYSLKVDIEEEPRVLIDSKSGIVISGGNIRISEAAISYGNMELRIGEQRTTQAFRQESKGENVKLLKSSTSVEELVQSLNQIGFTGSDIVKILQLLYKNGNLKARLIVQ